MINHEDPHQARVLTHPHARPPKRRMLIAKSLLGLAAIAAVAVGISLWTTAQSDPTAASGATAGNPVAESDSNSAALTPDQWADPAILDPVGYAADLNKLKTPAQIAEEAQAAFEISQPVAAAAKARATMTPERLETEAQVMAKMLDPVGTTAAREQSMTPEERAEVAKALTLIQNPSLP